MNREFVAFMSLLPGVSARLIVIGRDAHTILVRPDLPPLLVNLSTGETRLVAPGN